MHTNSRRPDFCDKKVPLRPIILNNQKRQKQPLKTNAINSNKLLVQEKNTHWPQIKISEIKGREIGIPKFK